MTEVRAASVSKRVLIRLSDHQEIGVQDISRPGNQDALEMVRGFAPYGLFDNCRGSSTNRPPFLQNKANFRKGQTNVFFFITKDYEKTRSCGVQQSKAKQSQFVFFTAENAKHGEQKGICVTDCIIRKYNLCLLSLWSLRTRRLMTGKANFERSTHLLTARGGFLKESATAAENTRRRADSAFRQQNSFFISTVRTDGY